MNWSERRRVRKRNVNTRIFNRAGGHRIFNRAGGRFVDDTSRPRKNISVPGARVRWTVFQLPRHQKTANTYASHAAFGKTATSRLMTVTDATMARRHHRVFHYTGGHKDGFGVPVVRQSNVNK